METPSFLALFDLYLGWILLLSRDIATTCWVATAWGAVGMVPITCVCTAWPLPGPPAVTVVACWITNYKKQKPAGKRNRFLKCCFLCINLSVTDLLEVQRGSANFNIHNQESSMGTEPSPTRHLPFRIQALNIWILAWTMDLMLHVDLHWQASRTVGEFIDILKQFLWPNEQFPWPTFVAVPIICKMLPKGDKQAYHTEYKACIICFFISFKNVIKHSNLPDMMP